MRADSNRAGHGPPGSDPELLAEQLFEESGVDYAILIPNTAPFRADEEEEMALAAAQNRWLAATWLSRYNDEKRFFGSILVCPRDTAAAVQEIELYGRQPGFVQVLIYLPSAPPLGTRPFWPIYEAAAAHGLPVAIHTNSRAGMQRLSPVGFPSHYLDQRVTQWLTVGAHLASLIFEGVFERFPALRFVFVESGFLWMLPFVWRLDNHWARLGGEVPSLKHRPSEYVLEHIRMTTQPFEAGPGHDSPLKDFHQMLDRMHAERILMFATDYPHWDGDYKPTEVLQRLEKGMRRRIALTNALDLYGVPASRA
jgi:predicted TIM-barrel fold metal-dependent hydrolase